MTGTGWRLERITRHRFLVHGAAVVWLTGAALVMLAPALSHGLSLGPSDLLSAFGLTARSGVVVHNFVSADQIQVFIPWTAQAWTQVHHGQLPLWNPYSLLGMPLAFNWQSAPFSVPSLIGYLFPMNLAYSAAIVIRLVIAGTGGYLVGRVMGMTWLGSTLTGTVFELSGSLSGWAGWSLVGTLAWAGWALAATSTSLARQSPDTRHGVLGTRRGTGDLPRRFPGERRYAPALPGRVHRRPAGGPGRPDTALRNCCRASTWRWDCSPGHSSRTR